MAVGCAQLARASAVRQLWLCSGVSTHVTRRPPLTTWLAARRPCPQADRVAWSTHKPLIGANSGQTWGNVSIEVGSGMSLSEANVWIGGHS